MIELFRGYMDETWRTKKECLNWYRNKYNTHLNERMFRTWVEKYNQKYTGGEKEMFIAHSNKGYMMTSNVDAIRRSLADDYKRAMKLLVRNSRCTKALSEKNQLTLMPNEADMYEVVMKMYES